MHQCKRRWEWILVSALTWGGLTGLACSATVSTWGEPSAATSSSQAVVAEAKLPPPESSKVLLSQAFEAAITAAQLAQSATTASEWSAVATAWAEAIQALQAIPTDSPEWLFAQRKTREYLANQAIALQRVEEAARLAIFPPLGNPVLDEQLALYLSYIATFDNPDILIIGSSRALQGLNPQILQQRLAEQGYTDLKVYNFAVNGATAQVVSFILRYLLTPEQMPKMIIWAGGSRSFNSGRFDRTFAQILESPGFAAVQAGDRPTFESATPLAATLDTDNASRFTARDKTQAMPVSSINGYGFLAVNDVFNPDTYYQSFPRVPGAYDDAYLNFNLEGVQAVSTRAIATFARSNNIPLIFINLPLSDDYLDETRSAYEQQFQQFLQQEAQNGDFVVVDLLNEWPGQNLFFADPSHLNRVGAAQVAIRVSETDTIPWDVLAAPAEPPTEE
ncbi:hypothetical protein [Leptolyngbya iicbica]|uniref:DUF1574 domain-containing protein n=2 Tax=Cyanophyceae TaxID=3028117 RepID=A0A4Q7E8V7_9CYAN|nr:hypothetical protein [Leptolyngbya sp. LK]RZM79257.1 hypothetical protein DYY88_10935 [Leptolyngbya sp. LK]